MLAKTAAAEPDAAFSRGLHNWVDLQYISYLILGCLFLWQINSFDRHIHLRSCADGFDTRAATASWQRQ